MKNKPRIIYLQVGDDCPSDVDFNECRENVTWGADKVFENDLGPYLDANRLIHAIDLEIQLKKNPETGLIPDNAFLTVGGLMWLKKKIQEMMDRRNPH